MGIVLLVVGFGLGYLAFGNNFNNVTNMPMYRLGGGSSSDGPGEGVFWPGKMMWRNDREAIGLGADFDPERMRGWCLSQFATTTGQ